MSRVGLFGGTFDPPHLGHLVVALECRHRLDLDEVRLVVANDPWQKSSDRRITPAATRLELVELAVRDLDGLTVSEVEITAGGPSYTVETLEALAAREPDAEFSLIVGADAAAGLDTWHRAEDLRAIAEVVVVNRGDDERDAPAGWRSRRITVPAIGISSTDLRARVAAGVSIRLLTPDAVIAAVTERGLYLPVV